MFVIFKWEKVNLFSICIIQLELFTYLSDVFVNVNKKVFITAWWFFTVSL